MDGLPISIQELEPCIPSRRARRKQALDLVLND
jgi:hypothetical protein